MGSNPLNWMVALLTFFLEIVIFAFLFLSIRKNKRLKKQNMTQRQEKEVIFEFVHDIGEVFAEAEEIDLNGLLKRILFFATKTVRSTSGCLYMVNKSLERLEARAVSGIFAPLHDAEDLQIEEVLAKSKHIENFIRSHPVPLGDGLIGTAASLGRAFIIEDAELDARVPHYTDEFLRIRSLLVVPMRFGNEVIGVLALTNRTDNTPFTPADLSLVQAMADQASVPIHYADLRAALEQKRLIDRDLHVAREIQHSLLPQNIPEMPGVKLHAFNTPAYDIGGDYYDFIPIDDTHLGIAVADVSGKGVGGALMMSVCQSVLRSCAHEELDPAKVLSNLNRVVSANLAEDMFITMLYMVLDTEKRELCYARAGHERPLLCRANNGGPQELDSAGIAVGLADADLFETAINAQCITLEPGDIVTAYTDGITEAQNETGEEWTEKALLSVLEEAAPQGGKDVIRRIREDINGHVGSQMQYDDMTLLILEMH